MSMDSSVLGRKCWKVAAGAVSGRVVVARWENSPVPADLVMMATAPCAPTLQLILGACAVSAQVLFCKGSGC